MQPRRDGRPVGREPDFLSSFTWRRRRRGKETADSCLCRGDREPLRHRAAPRSITGDFVRPRGSGDVVMKRAVNEIREVEAAHLQFDVDHWREDFPILKQKDHVKPLGYYVIASSIQQP